jgi:hypothetical protein
MKLQILLSALALGLVAPATPALAADPPPAGMVAVEGALRHEATGVTLPNSFNGWTPVVTEVNGVMALYMPKDLGQMLKGNVAIMGIDKFDGPHDYATMREAAAGSFHETGTPQILEENSFAWPGHPDAVTFHGVYLVGPYRKDYWRGWDQGWNAMVIVTTPRGDKKLGEKLSTLVASDVYGGATLRDAPAAVTDAPAAH